MVSGCYQFKLKSVSWLAFSNICPLFYLSSRHWIGVLHAGYTVVHISLPRDVWDLRTETATS